jgi:hypothetical protein
MHVMHSHKSHQCDGSYAIHLPELIRGGVDLHTPIVSAGAPCYAPASALIPTLTFTPHTRVHTRAVTQPATTFHTMTNILAPTATLTRAPPFSPILTAIQELARAEAEMAQLSADLDEATEGFERAKVTALKTAAKAFTTSAEAALTKVSDSVNDCYAAHQGVSILLLDFFPNLARNHNAGLPSLHVFDAQIRDHAHSPEPPLPSNVVFVWQELRMLRAIRSLAEELPPVPVHLVDDKSRFARCAEVSDQIVADAVAETKMALLFCNDGQVRARVQPFTLVPLWFFRL